MSDSALHNMMIRHVRLLPQPCVAGVGNESGTESGTGPGAGQRMPAETRSPSGTRSDGTGSGAVSRSISQAAGQTVGQTSARAVSLSAARSAVSVQSAPLAPSVSSASSGSGLRFPEPLIHELSVDQLERLLLWCVDHRASDIVFCPGDPVWMQKDGVWLAVTDSVLTETETQIVVNESSGQSNRAGMVKTGHSLDYAYAIRIPGERLLRQRFRVNATSSNKGLYVVLRVLPRSLPRLEDMEDLSPDLVEALFPASGLVVVSGVMGSGKSTLLAAILHKALLNPRVGRQILTLEDPIEFDFSSISADRRVAPVTQSAVHIDVEDWPGGVRTLTRRKGEIVMVGECRDRMTLEALLATVEQGVTAYTTVHAQDVPQTLTRMIHAFPEEERSAVAAVLKANIRVLIHQRLVPRKRPCPAAASGGVGETGSSVPRAREVPGRVALREILVVGPELRRHLYTIPDERLLQEVRALVSQCGQSLLEDARSKLARGLISEDTYAALVREQQGQHRRLVFRSGQVPGSDRDRVTNTRTNTGADTNAGQNARRGRARSPASSPVPFPGNRIPTPSEQGC